MKFRSWANLTGFIDKQVPDPHGLETNEIDSVVYLYGIQWASEQGENYNLVSGDGPKNDGNPEGRTFADYCCRLWVLVHRKGEGG